MIYGCQDEHICFSNDDLKFCGMKDCNKNLVVISPEDIDWFYKINKTGLCIKRNDLHKIMEDHNMPKKVKQKIGKIFFNL
jgi:hypothetical protein